MNRKKMRREKKRCTGTVNEGKRMTREKARGMEGKEKTETKGRMGRRYEGN